MSSAPDGTDASCLVLFGSPGGGVEKNYKRGLQLPKGNMK